MEGSKKGRKEEGKKGNEEGKKGQYIRKNCKCMYTYS